MRKYHPITLLFILVIIFASSLAKAQISNLQYRPILYLPGDNLDIACHAWLEFEHPVVTDFQFLNLRVVNPDNGNTAWVVVNFPIAPDATPRPVRYRMDLCDLTSPGLPVLPEAVLVQGHLGEYSVDGTFPTTIVQTLVAQQEQHFVPTGSPVLTHLVIPRFPLIILPPVIPDTFEYLSRECNVPNIDLDSLANPDPVTGDVNSCAPAAAANSLKWLMNVHPEIAGTDSLRGIMDTLEALMMKDSNGVQWENFIEGKLAYIDKHKLPIRVKYQVHTPYPAYKPVIASPDSTYGHAAENETGPGGFPDFDWVCNELKEGEDVEMQMTYWCDSAGVRVQRTTHQINVTGYFKFGNNMWLAWKHDVDQTGPGGTVEEYGQWCVDSVGYPYLKEMSETDTGCIAYVGSVVSESYDPNIVFTDVTKYDWSYKKIEYINGSIQDGYPYHVWLAFDLPVDSVFQFLNLRICSPSTGGALWVDNIPLPDVGVSFPVRLKLDLGALAQGDSLPQPLIVKYHIGEKQSGPGFPAQSYVIPDFSGPGDPFYVPNGGDIGLHLQIPAIPVVPLFFDTIPPINIDHLLRGCEVPNIDLDSIQYPYDPTNPESADILACGPAAAANSMQWLDDQHEEIDIPLEIRPLLDSLKRLMKLNAWSDPNPEVEDSSGVLYTDFIAGKLALIDQYQLPISVKFQSHNTDGDIASPDSTYGHFADNQSDAQTGHVSYDWMANEIEEGEDVEMLMGYWCDTILYEEVIDTIITDTLQDGTIVMDTFYISVPSDTVRERKGGHYINMTGFIRIDTLRWVTYKQDVYQRGPGGTTRDNTPDGFKYTDLSRWRMDSVGYPFLEQESYREVDGDTCRAYVETIISESLDTTVKFCPKLICTPSDSLLREAIKCAQPGDVIRLCASLKGDTIMLDSALVIDKDITILSNADSITISGSNADRAIEIEPATSVRIEGIAVISGSANAGSAIKNAGNLKLKDVNVFDRDGAGGNTNLIENTGSGTMTIEGETNVRRE